MGNDNYPAGVTNAHPHFNPDERPATVSCTSDEALVIPSFAVKARLHEIRALAGHAANMAAVDLYLEQLQREIDEMEKEGGYECQWTGELDLPVSEEAEFDCPRCGTTQTADTLPDDMTDDDYDRYKESRYDD